MTKILFVVPPLAGHVNPTLAIGRSLRDQGHEVAWVGCGIRVKALLPSDLPLIPLYNLGIESINEAWMQKAQRVSGLESFQFFYRDFLIPLAEAMLPGVEEAISSFQPDVILCDQQALAGALAARRMNIPWATLATTPAAVFNPIVQFPKVKEWMVEILGQIQDKYGLDRWERPDLSNDRVLILSTHELVGEEKDVPESFQFIGPSLRSESDIAPIAFPWTDLQVDTKKIYLSLGTINADRSRKFYAKVKEAFADKPVQLIVSAPPEMLGDIPKNFIVQKVIPQLEILPIVDAVIFHGGHNTFTEALFHGVPAVVAPIKDDQPVIAEQLVRSGAGLRVHFERVKSADLWKTTERVLYEPEFRDAARRIAKTLKNCGGSTLAAKHLLTMAAREKRA
ncbi:MAG: glycosyltransferase [Proteobacteria bacterium]|nr:MAG: glycosyltransferase [Pseudomonadota bacterium]